MKIGVVIGSTRPGRLGAQVGRWVHEQAQAVEGLGDIEFELVDLADYDLDLLNEPTVPGAAKRQYENPKTRRWSEKVDELDAFLWVSPEYNHGVPAAMKNAFDVLYPEWAHKGVGVVGYGTDGAVRATEHWRTILANAQMHVVRSQLSISTMTEVATDAEGQQVFTPADRRATEVATLVKAVIKLTNATRALRV